MSASFQIQLLKLEIIHPLLLIIYRWKIILYCCFNLEHFTVREVEQIFICLVAICVSQPVNHVCTPPGQDVFQDFFHIILHLTLTFHMQNVRSVLFFSVCTHLICKKSPELFLKYPMSEWKNCFIFKFSFCFWTF